MKEVREYIANNWAKTFHDPSEMRGDFVVPKPYISPSIGGMYTDLYYWDVYFMNLGLMIDGHDEQVENNLDNMAYFINTLGYMPNANTLADRSQPPLFCSAVYDYYVHKGDKAIIEKYMPYILKEYEFWQTQRMTPYGVNNFSTNADEELKMLDVVVLGYHKASKLTFKQFVKFLLPNMLRKKPTKKQIERNTMAYIRAMDKHRINILAHLGYAGCAVDCVRLAEECVKRNIYIELNGKRINFKKQDILGMVATGVKFIIDSDAHKKENVGKNSMAFNLIEKYDIPLEQVANVDKLPTFNK